MLKRTTLCMQRKSIGRTTMQNVIRNATTVFRIDAAVSEFYSMSYKMRKKTQ